MNWKGGRDAVFNFIPERDNQKSVKTTPLQGHHVPAQPAIFN